jgi:hypothetical protein
MLPATSRPLGARSNLSYSSAALPSVTARTLHLALVEHLVHEVALPLRPSGWVLADIVLDRVYTFS